MWILACVTPRQTSLPASLQLKTFGAVNKDDDVQDNVDVQLPATSSSADNLVLDMQMIMNAQIGEMLVVEVLDSQGE